ncbi:WAT1-related protein [Pyrus ussuriensis x Pyrus communis]|uniref:WAT1-related protein n=1 Tax=Pyrus ussuriensis x Pyrus communis TaxID=2448454 RepID=A0A5N5HF19_9ROSA|nr:WAT1-related protein [Pyrus ussuriensis x Pyrus communis]
MGKIAALPIVGMVLGECAQAGLIIISKIAMSNGMSNLIFLCYSNALAALILLLISLSPPLTFSIIGWFNLLGLIGFMAQFLGYAGIKYSSPTPSTAMLNLIPAFTFVLAVIFRAFIATLYKGPRILNTSSTVMTDMLSHKQLLSEQSNWVLGRVCLAANCILAASWPIVQASVLKKYRAELIMVFNYCFFVAIQSVVGVFGSAFQVGVSTWCLRRTGPVFVAMFKPLGIVVAVFIGVTFLGDTFYLGSLIGAVVIVSGFYSVMWGKPMKRRGVMMQGKEACISESWIPWFKLHSPILVCAMGLMIPSFSSCSHSGLRAKLDWRSSSFQAKVSGTLISITGAIVVELYKGEYIRKSSVSSSDWYINQLQLRVEKLGLIFSSEKEHWVVGGLLLAASTLSVAVWNIIQMGTMKLYPQVEVMEVVTLYSLLGTIQSAMLSLFLERNPSAWKLKLNGELLLIVLTAIFGGLVRSRVQHWCMNMKGPYYVPLFKPFGIVFATIFGVSLSANGREDEKHDQDHCVDENLESSSERKRKRYTPRDMGVLLENTRKIAGMLWPVVDAQQIPHV